MVKKSLRRVVLALCASALFLTGCGGSSSDGPSGDVEGKVQLDGKPLPEGTVVFSDAKTGATDAAQLDKSGNFKIEAPLAVGEYRVSFEPPPPPQPTDEASGKKARIPWVIHRGYQASSTSDQVAVVKEGTNEFEFQLSKKGPKKSTKR